MIASLPRPSAVLMGPQRLAPTVDQALKLLGVDGQVAVITAGWQEREREDGELVEALGGRPAVNLELHARGDQVFADDPELFSAHRDKQDTVKRLQDLYRRRLGHAMAAARDMQNRLEAAPGSPDTGAPAELVEPQLSGSIEWVRQLDNEHARQVQEINDRYEERMRPLERPSLGPHREALMQLLESCSVVAIAGGHVAVLLNRLELFGLAEQLASRPIVAWSAGAMVLTERIVLFHDSPPQGRGYAEVMGRGLGILPDVVVFPHARRRLLLDNKKRIALLARRFVPRTCVTLDERSWLSYYVGSLGNGMWRANELARRLEIDGSCVAMETP